MNIPAPTNERDQPSVRKADASVMVIFGATGDLTRRKLIPALCNLAAANLLNNHFAVIAFAHTALTGESFRERLTEDIRQFATASMPLELWNWLRKRIYFVRGDFQSVSAYQQLKEQITQAEKENGPLENIFYYLAVAPHVVGEIVRQLGAAGLARETGSQWRRIIIEKPFGRDLESARALNTEIRQVFSEQQIYRIDHYLGKETVQNLLIFRFGNGLFEPIWNRRYIDHVQITATEAIGVGSRGAYYDAMGALRDMVPSHLFQLLSLTAMEPPISFQADAVRNEQAKVLNATQPLRPEEVLSAAVRGQYGEGEINGERVRAYRAEPNVSPNSNTETFVALKLRIDNWRWADVPFYLRTGKRLAKRLTEIAIQFKRAPFQLFRDTSIEALKTNRLIIHIQPDEGISLQFGAKVPGPVMRVGAVEMDFDYVDYFRCTPTTGYERLLYDCMIGDQTLFQRADMVEAGWAVVTPILDVWKALPPRDFPNYPAGSWGPMAADELLARDGRDWRNLMVELKPHRAETHDHIVEYA
jgi:glucose-6-phosphate 1-dehydrogenase